MSTLLCTIDFKLRTPGDDFASVVDVFLQHPTQTKNLWSSTTFNEGQKNTSKVETQLSVLQKLVEDFMWLNITLELNNNPHFRLICVVVDAGDAFDFFVTGQLTDVLNQAAFDNLIGKLSDDNRGLAIFHWLEVRLGLHRHRTTPGFVCRNDSSRTVDHAGCREVRPLDKLHQIRNGSVRIVNQVRDGITDLTQVMRRHICRHTDGNATRAITDQVREFSGENRWLTTFVVIGGNEVDRVLFDVLHHFHRKRRQTGFRVPHRSGRIIIHRTEVPLTIHQRIAQRERLRHTHHGAVESLIAVRMVVTHRFADNLRRFQVTRVRGQPELTHRIQNTTLYRL